MEPDDSGLSFIVSCVCAVQPNKTYVCVCGLSLINTALLKEYAAIY